jgi:hypothetical protein
VNIGQLKKTAREHGQRAKSKRYEAEDNIEE